jgi:5'-3' exonuclease
MILVDLNQVLLAGLMAQINSQKGVKLEENLVRHMVLNIIRTHIKNFRAEYGEVVLCCDNRKYWRKEFFPFYKAGRKKNREKSDLDWHMIFDILAKLKQELKEHFPYKVIDVEGAEADDIIGTLVPRHIMHENILILSSDGDFLQLQQYNGKTKFKIKQYNPSLRKYVTSDDPLLDLKEKIIRGDKGDGIPNVFSPSDCFVRELRQKPITKGIIDKLLNEDWNNWQDDVAKTGFSRNQILIDLKMIPSEIKENIINTFDQIKPASKNNLLNYFMEHRLKILMEVIEEF